MAEAAAARREARRRRILENSHNRLQLISGKSSEDCRREPPIIENCFDQESVISTPPPSISSSYCLPPVNNGAIVTENESHNLLSDVHENAAGDTEIKNDLANLLSSSTEPAQQKSTWEKIYTTKYDIVIMALIYQLCEAFFEYEPEYFFLPLIIYSITKLLMTREESKSGIANVFLLMNGVSGNKAVYLLNTMQWVGTIAQEICIYLFVTICIQSLMCTLNVNVLT